MLLSTVCYGRIVPSGAEINLDESRPMSRKIVSARDLERLGILKRRTALRMAKLGIIPHYKFGERRHRVGFIPDEVLKSLKRGDSDE